MKKQQFGMDRLRAPRFHGGDRDAGDLLREAAHELVGVCPSLRAGALSAAMICSLVRGLGLGLSLRTIKASAGKRDTYP